MEELKMAKVCVVDTQEMGALKTGTIEALSLSKQIKNTLKLDGSTSREHHQQQKQRRK